MTNRINHLCFAVMLLGSVLSLSAATPDAAKAPAKEEPKEIVIPKAKFEYDNKKGKDPFFPKSVRWTPIPKEEPKLVPGTTTVAPPIVVKIDPYKHFSLKGVTGIGNTRLVVINSGVKGKNYLLGLGESKSVVTPDGNYRVKVTAFTDTGAEIQIEGEKAAKPLSLPK